MADPAERGPAERGPTERGPTATAAVRWYVYGTIRSMTSRAMGKPGLEPTAGAPVRRILLASLIGTTIEFFDFYIYATAAVA